MCVVDQPVEDAISQSGIANLFVPARDWQLRSQRHPSFQGLREDKDPKEVIKEG
jgi:hypothetical protein